MPEKLIFVYNADSGLFNTMTDIAHKIFSPSTYNCQLCALTHSYFSMRDEWKDFLDSINIDMQFLHRDEFVAQYPGITDDLPAVYIDKDGLKVLISADDIKSCDTLDQLKALISSRVSDR